MVIRPLVAAKILGETGRPAGKGALSGPAAFYSVGDKVTLGEMRGSAKLYSAPALFKMTGAVELMSDEFDLPASDAPDFSDKPVLF